MSERASAVEIVRVGKHWRLSCFQHVPHPIQKVFSFFGSARNLERLTPGFLRFRFRKLPTEPLQAGATIDYQLRLHGIPVWWRTRIDEWCPPRRFVDVQIRGLFRRWHHTHEFMVDGSGTVIKDTVNFDLYFRSLYRTPVLRWINTDLRLIFEYRRRQTTKILAGDKLVEVVERTSEVSFK